MTTTAATNSQSAPKKRRGRPPIDQAGTEVITLRLTQRQKYTFDRIGAMNWLRAELDMLDNEIDQAEEQHQ